MRIDLGGWALGFTGCFVDWLLTRQWRRVFFGFLPLMAAVTVGGLVAWGSRIDRDQLADRYLQLANNEVKAWEEQWAPAQNETVSESDASESDASESDTSESDAADKAGPADDQPEKALQIPPFAETLFRRIQQLHSGDQRSAFFIAMTLAQRGSLHLALARLQNIAPPDREGYLPAHAMLAQILLNRPIAVESLSTVKHHARAALRWKLAPGALLAQISELFWETGDHDTAVEAMTLAAQRDAKYYLLLIKLTSQDGKWKLQNEQALVKGEAYFKRQISSNPRDVQDRARFADVLLMKGDLAAAEQLVAEGLKTDDNAILRRKLSDIYLIRFLSTSQITEKAWSGQFELLEQAFRVDPTNEKVFEQVAKLTRINGTAPEELLSQLRKLLAAGTATSVAHMWISEYYLTKNNMALAVPHLEQAVKRDPNAARCWNNLAYCLAALYPDRLEEALACADQAVQRIKNVAEFQDTRGTVLSTMGRHKDAIDAFERAVELVALEPRINPPNPGYHERLAAAYEAVGDKAMAAEHARVAAEWRKRADALANRPVSVKQTTEQPPTEQPPTEQPPTEQPPTEQPPTEQQSAERAESDNDAVQAAAGEEGTTETLSPDAPSPEQP